ncbi:NAD(P)/FAD-dependent oxidoreductase [Lewinella sp. JB7]|uniref:dihydrolipoyl dehydrogenase family protein n=1 Tax=Lewinella sp. JB7 TaxID=2962887 RepID=UPI0020C97813|nr:NAD(P)/FAD-dependent oxidoreductase [Lewinella sp. JB7]MCP9235596.1 NAD(P)/FAD-dependent oxidoreductase [Lewinella sp. JB7]
MSMKEYDVVVIGAGSAGQSVAAAAAKAGKTVAITEGREYGGTCPLRGCDPKLVLHAAAETMHRLHNLRGKGFTSDPDFSWPDLMEWKRSFTEPIPENSQERMRENGVEVYESYATFIDAHTLQLTDEVRIKGKTIVVATGLRPTPLDFPGSEYLYTSDDFLEMDELPGEMVIVGGGYIGTETSQISHALGCRVTVIVSDDVPLSKFDHDLAGLLLTSAEERGIKFHLNTRAKAIRKTGDRFEVDVEDKDGQQTTLTTDRVIHCAGRTPNIGELDLDAAGIEHDKKKGIVVDDRLRTNLPHVYAVGDCTDNGLPLSPVASYDATVLSEILFEGSDRKVEYYPLPTVAFSLPGMAAVGMTADEAQKARKEGRKIAERFADASDWYHARHLNSPVFAYKVFLDEDEDRILGAHLLGPDVTELINLFYLAILQKTRVAELKKMIFAYPTPASTLKSML